MNRKTAQRWDTSVRKSVLATAALLFCAGAILGLWQSRPVPPVSVWHDTGFKTVFFLPSGLSDRVNSAAQLLLTAGDNPERLKSEASFAALCGVSPAPASSGKIVRHRLNRGGDRAVKSAIHIIAIG